jgi:hypothetical protein
VSDRLEQLGTFCALTPVVDVDALCTELESWPRASGSPLARIAQTHFARFVVIPGVERQVAEQPDDELDDRPYLMASAFFDGEPLAWLDALLDKLPDEADRVWRHCRGYPGRERGALRSWLLDHRVEATAVFGAYPDATVAQVRDAVAFRRRFRDFAFGGGAGLDDFRAFAAGERR